MNVKKLTLGGKDFPEVLAHIPQPPPELYVAGAPLADLLQYPRVAVVGSRKVSTYGRAVTSQLAGELARAGVVIVSGLAIGVDALAHKAALEAGGLTIAVLPSGLDRIYPGSHYQLALQIIKQGGALVTEYPSGTTPYPSNFIARNRIASGLSDGLLITEAAQKSGSLHTARFALEQGREVMAVPGNINSPTSAGTNNLIKSGATPVTQATDVLYALDIQPAPVTDHPAMFGTAQERQLLALIAQGTCDGDELLVASQLDVSLFNQTLTMLEITGKVRPLGNNQWGVY
ncbi:MAG TPA: DNA-processing protein DprA [Nevskiaceae bacterium]|nr:DNA-processing protein DprA [Nevskiaceae bacterium]